MSHGWGSSALVAMQEVLLGATPIQPGEDGPATAVSVGPPPSGLAHASGTFPTPAGEYAVAWRTSSEQTSLQLTVPPNAAARCRLRAATASQVHEGGSAVVHAPGVVVVSTGGGEVVLAVGAGTFDFTVTPG